MALKSVVKAIPRIHSKSQVLLRSIPKPADPTTFALKYQEYIKGLRSYAYEMNGDLLEFPVRSFYKFPNSSIKSIIDDALEELEKRNNNKSAYIYNCALRNYLKWNLKVDVADILQRMKANDVKMNLGTLRILLSIYTRMGDLEALKSIVEIIKSENVKFERSDILNVFACHIRGGKLEDGIAFLTSNGMNEKDPDATFYACLAYSAIGDVENLFQKINELKAVHQRFDKLGLHIYTEIVKVGLSQDYLDKLLNLIEKPYFDDLQHTVFILNQASYFNQSLALIKKYQMLINESGARRLLDSFLTKDCPINTFKEVVSLLIDRVKYSMNLFRFLDFEDSIKFATELMSVNKKMLFGSLIQKAIENKSVFDIQSSLEFGLENVNQNQLNEVILFRAIPYMLSSSMVANCEELIDVLPQYRSLILPIVMIHTLIKGQFAEFNNLIKYHRSASYIQLRINYNTLTTEILHNLTLKDVERMYTEMHKVFGPVFIKQLMQNLVLTKIRQSNELNNVTGVENAIQFANDFNIKITPQQLEYLKKDTNDNELYNLLQVEVQKPKEPRNENSDKTEATTMAN